MDDLDIVFRKLLDLSTVPLPIIACLYTSAKTPACAAPMPRLPAPSLGASVDLDFSSTLRGALNLNAAVHDGAVMLGRREVAAPYAVTGWSYRLFPPNTGETAVNRGSAFNSCLAMSGQPDVDRLYLVSRDGLFRFIGGKVTTLADGN
jgi:hypothetical protein